MERPVQTTNQKTKRVEKSINVWTTNFPNLLKATRKIKTTKSECNGLIKTTTDTFNISHRYKTLAHKSDVKKGVSCSCGKCMLCDQGKAVE